MSGSTTVGEDILLDSSVIVAAMRGGLVPSEILDDIDSALIPATVLGELLFGAEVSTQRTRNLTVVRGFAKAFTILSIMPSTAQIYAMLKAGLQRKGEMIPENDLWICALAMEHGLTLATLDDHFLGIAGLRTTDLGLGA